MEKPTYVVLLTYLGEPSVKLDNELETLASDLSCTPGTYSWDDTPYVRELEFFSSDEQNARALMLEVAKRYNGLCHQDIYPLHEA